ncbi:MAG TPA: hypothetical protein VK477_11135 [Acidobacteriota bacterium]|nr:hypothetical protein [Acidobacteriota bacterium]
MSQTAQANALNFAEREALLVAGSMRLPAPDLRTAEDKAVEQSRKMRAHWRQCRTGTRRQLFILSPA